MTGFLFTTVGVLLVESLRGDLRIELDKFCVDKRDRPARRIIFAETMIIHHCAAMLLRKYK